MSKVSIWNESWLGYFWISARLKNWGTGMGTELTLGGPSLIPMLGRAEQQLG